MAGLNASEGERRVVVFGEVLFDRFPDGSEVLGGAPFNVAWNLQAFDARPLLVSRVGNDRLGRRILAAMKDWGMDLGGMQVDEHRPTDLEVTQETWVVHPHPYDAPLAPGRVGRSFDEQRLVHGRETTRRG